MRVVITTLLIGIFLLSCTADDQASPMADDHAPDPVSNIQVEPIPGGAVLTYDLPNDESLRYVKALYDIRDGYTREAKSSLYKNSITIDGFPEVKEYQVNLYAVSRGENESEPVTVNVTPLKSPLIEAFETFEFRRTFGGVHISFKNEGKASLAVTLLTPNEAGEMAEVDTYYTQSPQGNFSLRGFPAEPIVFGAVVRDRWGNLSDTLTAEITPIFEEVIPKEFFTPYNLPTDTYEPHATSAWNMTKIWDDVIQPNGGNSVFHTAPGTGMPQWFTFDMGNLARLSRYKFYHRNRLGSYQNGAPKRWEVWGSAQEPDPSGSWDGWTLLTVSESYKPSGEGPITNEDMEYAAVQGEDFDFPEETPAVRYLRIKILETWGYVDYMYIGELTFYGEVQ